MTRSARRRGTLGHRILVFLLGSLLTLLFVWLFSFVLRDIGKIRGPRHSDFNWKYVTNEEFAQLRDLQQQKKDLGRRIDEQRKVQTILRDNTESSRETMDQFMALHLLRIEKGHAATPEEQEALAENRDLFLETQRKFQAANDLIVRLNDEQRELEERLRTLRNDHEIRLRPARDEHAQAAHKHQILIATYKLAFLIPVLLVSALLLFKKRGSGYLVIINALLISSAWMVGAVIHAHFPTKVFKYVAIGAAIAVVLGALIALIRRVITPNLDALLKQYRESYRRHRCPICSEPIQRGALRFARWTRKGPIVPESAIKSIESEGGYTCPSCGESLYEECGACETVRHSLLPYCEGCGVEKGVDVVR